MFNVHAHVYVHVLLCHLLMYIMHTHTGQENAVNDLLKIKEDLTAEVEQAQITAAESAKRMAELQAKVQELEEKK